VRRATVVLPIRWAQKATRSSRSRVSRAPERAAQGTFHADRLDPFRDAKAADAFLAQIGVDSDVQFRIIDAWVPWSVVTATLRRKGHPWMLTTSRSATRSRVR
jgi:hypothetical protein